MQHRMLVGLAAAFLSVGGRAVAYESIYTQTAPGEFEIKTVPAGTALRAESGRPYFESANMLFARLFNYIKAEEIQMTVPVEAEINPGAMLFFVSKEMPGKTLKSTENVKVSSRPAITVAALGIRGSYGKSNYENAARKLGNWLSRNPGYDADGEARMVYWSGPMTPFFLKRSEAQIPVKRRAKPALELNELTPEQRRVIIGKGTELPFSGKYNNETGVGAYLCRQCDTPLYRSDDKFKTNCGWPGFEDEIHGAVGKIADADGVRTEIVCARCGAHLGHVFEGENLTPKSLRHCVNSISMNFEPVNSEKIGRALFAGGCFWGVEYWMKRAPGVLAVTSGYTGGSKPYPSYEEVCSGKTGHAEAVEVIYDKRKVDYETLAELFLEIHDPAQLNRQGPDSGEQYRSAIFYYDNEQKQFAEKLIAELRERGLDAVTSIEPAGRFWPAEDFHQDYYGRKNAVPYCHERVRRFGVNGAPSKSEK